MNMDLLLVMCFCVVLLILGIREQSGVTASTVEVNGKAVIYSGIQKDIQHELRSVWIDYLKSRVEFTEEPEFDLMKHQQSMYQRIKEELRQQSLAYATVQMPKTQREKEVERVTRPRASFRDIPELDLDQEIYFRELGRIYSNKGSESCERRTLNVKPIIEEKDVHVVVAS